MNHYASTINTSPSISLGFRYFVDSAIRGGNLFDETDFKADEEHVKRAARCFFNFHFFCVDEPLYFLHAIADSLIRIFKQINSLMTTKWTLDADLEQSMVIAVKTLTENRRCRYMSDTMSIYITLCLYKNLNSLQCRSQTFWNVL